MKKVFYVFCLVFFLLGAGCGVKEDIVIKIDDIEVTEREFEAAFAASRFAEKGDLGRKDFLETYVTAKLILKEAEELGLDKEPEFLEDIQLFWEKALLKSMLSRKMAEVQEAFLVSDQEVLKYYQARIGTEFAGKSFEQVAGQIKWILVQERQRRAIGDWESSLRKAAHIKINFEELGIAE